MTNAAARQENWLAVISVALAMLVMVTSEFLPIGLLSTIAGNLSITHGRAALMVTVPGAVAAIAAPGLLLAMGTIDRRYVLVVLTALIGISNLVVATADGFGGVLLGRVLLGMGVGGLWVYAAAVGRRLVTDDDGDFAVTFILAGISIGTALGVPLGTWLASVLGWRTVFGIAAGASVVVVAMQWALLPMLSGQRPPSPRAIVAVAAVPSAKIGFIASALTASGHFTAYTFLEPQLTSVTGLSALAFGWAFGAYGVGGVAGTLIAGRAMQGDLRRVFVLTTFTMALAMAAVAVVGNSGWLAIAAVVVWGTCFAAVGICVQTWIYRAAPAEFEAGSALTVTVFQIALATGAYGGGLLVDKFGLTSAFLAGSALTLGCAVFLSLLRPAIVPSCRRVDG